MKTPTRPTPTGTADRGRPSYSGREIAAYRAARGVTQVEVAARMRTAQSLIARYESDKPGVILGVKWATLMLDATDEIAEGREKIAARGVADLAAIRAERKASRG